MIETKTKVINGNEYMVRQYGARLGGRIKVRLAKLIGPALTSFFDQKSGLTEPAAVEKAIGIFLDNLSVEEYDSLVMQMIPNYVWKNEKEITEKNFDMEFAGDYASLYKLLWFIIQVDYQDFLEMGGIGNLSQPQA